MECTPFLYFRNRRSIFFQNAYFPGTVTPEEGIAGELVGNLAAALMAIDHVNNRNGGVVKELSTQSFLECDISIDQYLTMDSLADELSFQLPSVLQGSNEDIPVFQRTQHTADADDWQITSTKINNTSICAVIGPFRSNVAMEVAKSTSVLNVPLISPLAASDNLDDYELFGRMTVGASVRSRVLMEYLDNLERNYIAILSSDDGVGTEFSMQMESSCEEIGRTCKSFKFRGDGANDGGHQSLQLALELVRESGFTTIVCSLDVINELDYLAKYSTGLGLQGEDYMWIIHCAESFLPIFNFVRAGRGSPVEEFFNGMGFFTVGVPTDKSEAFEESFRRSDEVFFNRVRDAIPISERSKYDALVKTNYFQQDYFGVTMDAAFVYDSVVAMALGACEVRKSLLNGNGYDNDNVFNDLVDRVFDASFMGASGNVAFDRPRRNRDVDAIKFAITNVRPREVREEGEEIFYRYDMVTTSTYSAGAWVDEAEFIYADGSGSAPFTLRLVDVEVVFMSEGLKLVSLCLSLFGLIVCFVLAAMVWVYREKKEIRISQPRFLYTILLTCVMRMFFVLMVLVDSSTPYLNEMLDEICLAKIYTLYLALTVRYTALIIKVRAFFSILHIPCTVYLWILLYGCMYLCFPSQVSSRASLLVSKTIANSHQFSVEHFAITVANAQYRSFFK